GEIRPQPALRLGDRHALPRRVVLDLVASDAADGEVAGLRVAEVEPADARSGQRGERLGQLQPGPCRDEEREQLRLLAVVGAGRIAERRPDAAIVLSEQVVAREALARRVPLPAGALVDPFREGLRE